MNKFFKTFFVIAVAAFIFSVASCFSIISSISGMGGMGTGHQAASKVLATSFVEDSVEEIGSEKYALVASCGDDIFGLKITSNGSNFILTQIDANTYVPVEEKSVNVNGINPSSMFVDEDFVYISSVNIHSAGQNKVLVYDKNNLSSVNQIGNSWNISDGIYHPAGVGADENNVYIVSGKTDVVRVYKKDSVRANWGKMHNNFNTADAYVKLPTTVPHSNESRATVYANNGILLITYGGSSSIYKIDVANIYNGKYRTFGNGKEADDTIRVPFNKSGLNNIAVSNGYASLQLGDSIIVLDENKFKNLDFSDYSFSLSSEPTEFSIVNTKLAGDFTAYTCKKGDNIKKTVLKAYNVSTVASNSRLSDISEASLLVKRDKMFKPEDTMDTISKLKIKLRQPIVDVFENDKLELYSFYMKDFKGGKYAIKVKGMNDEIVILDIKETLSPFQVRHYNMPFLSSGGTFKTVGGQTVRITKLNPNDIISTRIIHDDKSLSILNNLVCDWSISFSGSNAENARYIPVLEKDAKNYIQTFSNMAYAFGSDVMQDCLDHFTYFTRCVFISDVKNISDSTQVAWYHLDKEDPYYNPQDKTTFLNRVGVTDKWNSHWGLSIDTVQTGVGSYGGAGGGGWLAMSRGAFSQSGEDVVTYILAHEFGHTRGWQHGSSFAYGAFSDRANNSRLDFITDMLPNICKTLLHMGVLPYMEQFNPKDYDYMYLDQIETKVYLSGKKDWWSPALWNHVQKKVKAINDYADGIDNENLSKINLIKERVAFLKQHFENWKVANRKTGNNNQFFIQWRDAVSNNSELAWMKEDMPGRSGRYKSYWDEINETYGSGIPFDKIEEKAVRALSTKVNRDTYFNRWNFTNNTAFTIIKDGDKGFCQHPGHYL